ncbi:Fungal protein of unknown function (DUF1774) [Geosmithia morbida]|uniref:ATP synthase F0 n=1 Tax=Geosmithia morbida TaxID=1094350 RepID=A0A9P5D9T5_9HYPO|nr:Fungal protein of unknown function (DUF1774) [Geosmithia morbida]KAF4126859.1 Fungal protein of unknown function (DUF1774) [Geosmithia morbida]
MTSLAQYNPFAKRESHGQVSITTYKVLTLLTWILSVVVSVYYTLRAPHDGHNQNRRIWAQNKHHPSAFSLNSTISSIFWIVLFILQAGYIGHLFSSKQELRNAAASVGSHFIVNNLLHFAFVMLFVRSHFYWAEVFIVVNLFNLTSLYFRHSSYPRFIHTPVVSAPLAWTYVALFWNGGIMVPHSTGFIARVFGNIFIWTLLLHGLGYITVYKDYTMGFSLTVLTAALGVAQFTHKVIALQWIFAFIIMSLLFLATLTVAVPAWMGRDIRWNRGVVFTDSERAPLLNDSAPATA